LRQKGFYPISSQKSHPNPIDQALGQFGTKDFFISLKPSFDFRLFFFCRQLNEETTGKYSLFLE
jgi:hypothetical protein